MHSKILIFSFGRLGGCGVKMLSISFRRGNMAYNIGWLPHILYIQRCMIRSQWSIECGVNPNESCRRKLSIVRFLLFFSVSKIFFLFLSSQAIDEKLWKDKNKKIRHTTMKVRDLKTTKKFFFCWVKNAKRLYNKWH